MAIRKTAASAVICLYTILNGNVASAHSSNIFRTHIDIAAHALSRQLDIVTVSPKVTAPRPILYSHHRRRTYERNTRPTYGRLLASRGGTFGVGTPTTVVGRLGTVTADSAQIIGGPERYRELLSVVPKGQNIAIIGQTGDQYAVMMLDHSTGFIAKSSVRLLDLQVINSGASIPDPSDPNVADNSTPDSAAGTLGARLVNSATSMLGVPYLYGGETRDGIDCSAFVQTVYSENGITLPRVSRDQANVGYSVPMNDVSQWVPGDRMYFACHHPEIDHTGMYIGNGLFIHASAGHGYQVAIDHVNNPYYWSHLVAVRRSQELLGEVPTSPNLVATQPGSSVVTGQSITVINGSKVSQTPLAAPNSVQQASVPQSGSGQSAPPAESDPSSSSGVTPSISITTDQDPEASQQ